MQIQSISPNSSDPQLTPSLLLTLQETTFRRSVEVNFGGAQCRMRRTLSVPLLMGNLLSLLTQLHRNMEKHFSRPSQNEQEERHGEPRAYDLGKVKGEK